MPYIEVPYTTRLPEVLTELGGPGLLLVSAGRNGRPNAMTIGWGMVGLIWGKPIFTVLVRPTRYTYSLLAERPAFTVCLPAPGQEHVLDFCGSKSGRNHDKFAELGLSPLPSTRIDVPGIDGCPLIYECQVVHTNDILPDRLAPEILQDRYGQASQSGHYRQDTLHRVCYGEILTVRALQA